MKNFTPILLFLFNFFTLAYQYQIVERGSLHTKDYRVYLKNDAGEVISPWHDIPYIPEVKKNVHVPSEREAKTEFPVYNMVVEIPRWSNAKMEMATTEPMAPIKQDMKGEKMRYVNNIFPFHGYPWNYGALPQTWENPDHKDKWTKRDGDNDPIDVIEIGNKVHPSGSVIQVKILGILALLDDGETDWKLIAIDINDELAKEFHTLDDVEKKKPELFEQTRHWLTVYKLPTGKKANEFHQLGMNERDLEFAHAVIKETHEQYKALLEKKKREHSKKVNGNGMKVENGENKVEEAEMDVEGEEEVQKKVEKSKLNGKEVKVDKTANLNMEHNTPENQKKWAYLEPILKEPEPIPEDLYVNKVYYVKKNAKGEYVLAL